MFFSFENIHEFIQNDLKIFKVACLEEKSVQLTEERNTMAETLNRQKNDLTEMGSQVIDVGDLIHSY